MQLYLENLFENGWQLKVIYGCKRERIILYAPFVTKDAIQSTLMVIGKLIGSRKFQG